MMKWTKVRGLDKWKTEGYEIEQTADDPLTMVARATGEGNQPGEVGTYTAAEGYLAGWDETAAALLKRVKAACEAHAAGQPRQLLVWETEPVGPNTNLDDPLAWVTKDGRYRCRRVGGEWIANDGGSGDELGSGHDAEEAMAVCQAHADAEANGPPLEQAPGTAPHPEPPPAEVRRGDWMIPVELTEAEMAERGEELGRITLELGQQTLEIAMAKEAARRAIKAAEAKIEELNAEAMPLAQQLRDGVEDRLTDCVRHRDSAAGEVWYTHPITGVELHRHAVPKGEQQGLWGQATPPPDKPPPAAEPTLDELLGAARSLGESVLLADSAPSIDPPDSRWPWGEWSWHPLIRRLQAELQDLLGPEAEDTKALESLRWRKIPGQSEWIAGTPPNEYRVDGTSGVLVAVSRWAPGQEPTEIGRQNKGEEQKAAKQRLKRLCQEHLDSRLVWPGSPAGDVMLDSTGHYQLSRHGQQRRAQYLGGQDEDVTELGDHSLEDARVACQAHADKAAGWTQ